MREATSTRRPARFAAAGLTDVGRQRRHNEDFVLVKAELGLFAVADGMGGHNAGDIASKLAATSLWNFFEATPDGRVPVEPTADEVPLPTHARRLAAGIRKANHDVFEISCTYQQHSGMGSTLVAAFVESETGVVHIGHVGDSRCYRLRDGAFELLTRDHSLVNDALDLKPDLTEDELARLPKNIITRALGMKDGVKVDVRSEPVRSGDLFLLCSDGLSGMIEEEEIAQVFSITEDLKEACELLIAMANDAGGSDNISALAVRIEEGPEEDDRIAEDEPPEENPDIEGPLDEDLPDGVHRPGQVSAPDVSTEPVQELLVDPIKQLGGTVAEDVMRMLATGAEVEVNETTLLTVPTEVRVARCKTCRMELFVGNLFCVECGTPVD